MTNKYNYDEYINKINNNKIQQFELLIKIKTFIKKLNLPNLFIKCKIQDVSKYFIYYKDYYDYLLK